MNVTRLLNLAVKVFKDNDNKVIEIDGRAKETIVNLFKNNKSQKLTCMPNIKAIKEPTFSILNTKKTFNYLRQAFIKALILENFELESYI